METDQEKESAQVALVKGFEEAEKLLNDEDKMERLLQRLEKKLRVIPLAGDKLAYVPIMTSLVRAYVKKEYTDIPIGSIIAIISALLYFISPIDFAPDSLMGLGYFDDAAVIGVCLKLVDTDVSEYVKWRKDKNKVLNI